MAGDWIKMRSDLFTHPKIVRMASALKADSGSIVVCLYKLASWVSMHGKYGRVKADLHIIDDVVGLSGIGSELLNADWLRQFGDQVEVRGFFKPHTERKGLGKSLRSKLLDGSVCANCGSDDRLEIDHIIPIAAGGNSEIENLQVLCFVCNRKKGAKHGG